MAWALHSTEPEGCSPKGEGYISCMACDCHAICIIYPKGGGACALLGSNRHVIEQMTRPTFICPQGSAIIKIQSLLAGTVWDLQSLQNFSNSLTMGYIPSCNTIVYRWLMTLVHEMSVHQSRPVTVDSKFRSASSNRFIFCILFSQSIQHVCMVLHDPQTYLELDRLCVQLQRPLLRLRHPQISHWSAL